MPRIISATAGGRWRSCATSPSGSRSRSTASACRSAARVASTPSTWRGSSGWSSWLGPAEFSEHLAWSTHDGAFLNDLLPLPYTAATLARVAHHIDEVQQALGRRMLLENPSSYLAFAASTWSETDFLAELVRRTGCGLLLDVNNVFVSATNLGYAPQDYIAAFPLHAVAELHLGGHDTDEDDEGAPLLIDSHGREVADPVWALLDLTLAATGPRPVLIEWDTDVPDWPVLAAEAGRAAAALERVPA